MIGNWKRLDDFSRTDGQNSEVRRRLGIPAGALVVVCITQLFKDRKIEELLTAVEQSPDIYLIIGGKGILKRLVEERAASSPRIIFVGYASGNEIADYTCAADVVYYGFDPENPNARFSAPNKLYEAIAAGKPLVTGDFGEIADVVREAGCGIILGAYNPVEIKRAFLALTESAFRNRLAANARRFGRESMNWKKGEERLYREYSVFLKHLQAPGSFSRVAGEGSR